MRRHWASVLVVATCAAAGAAQPAVSLLETPAPLRDALHSRFGKDARILRLIVRAEGAVVEVQDAAVPMHVDRYEFDDGVLGTGEPVQVGRNQKALNARLFPLADVDLSIVPGLLADAVARTQTDDAKATLVTIERTDAYTDYESWTRPVIRVNVEGPRGGGFVEYQLDGKKKRVTRW